MEKKVQYVRFMNDREFGRLTGEGGLNLVYHSFGDIRLVVANEPEVWSVQNISETDRVDFYYFDENDKLLTRDMVFDRAMKHTREIMPPRIYMNEKIGGIDLKRRGLFMKGEVGEKGFNYYVGGNLNAGAWGRRGIRYTTSSWVGGAIAVFYPDALARLGEMLEQDFYVTFLNRNEARIHPVNCINSDEVHEAILYWNKYAKNAGPSNWVTDKVYRYCRNRHELQEVEYYKW